MHFFIPNICWKAYEILGNIFFLLEIRSFLCG